MRPRRMPKLSCRTLARGARQFVVHEAFERIVCFAGSYACWFTPMQIVRSAPFAGAEMITFFAPASRDVAAERAVDGVVLEQMRQRLVVGDVVHRDELEGALLEAGAEHVPADPSET